MNKTLKWVLAVIHLIIIVIAMAWISEKFEYEPLIILIAEIAALLAIIFEKRFAKLFIQDVSDSNISINPPANTNVKISKIRNKSDVKIK